VTLETLRDADPPVTLEALRDAVPARCFRPSTARSLVHLALDLALLGALVAASTRVEGAAAHAVAIFLQGTLFWALFVIGHDCGHGAFSPRPRWNAWVGHLLHTPLLVPYHAWRLSHRAHHRHAGDVARDEAWPPLTRAQVRALPPATRFLRLRAFPLVFPFYLVRNGPGRAGSHFDADGPLFRDVERPAVRRSVAACGAFALGLALAAWQLGPAPVVRHWLLPWGVFCVWAAVVTYLHHTDARIPWYRGAAWSHLRGALATVDRRYGPFEWLHHDAGCHVVHHLFPRIPHYRLREAARAVAPRLGAHYRRADAGVLRSLWRAARRCQVVPEAGERVFYEPLAPDACPSLVPDACPSLVPDARASLVPDARGSLMPDAARAWSAPPSGAGSSPATR
jgi:omega-3 fatty acid desaturase (delta-15 desaturase)